MKKLIQASLTVLLAGATAVPALAAEDRARSVGGSYATRDEGKGRYREDGEHRGDRADRRDNRRDNRQDWRAERRDDRRDWRDDRHEDRREWRDNRRDWRAERRDDRRDWRDDRRDDRRDWRNDWRHERHYRYARHDDRRWRGYQWRPEYRYRAPVRYVYPSGYRYQRWNVGHRLPPPFYGRPAYYVDYNAYHLPPPPYGHRWVRVDRDVVLVAVATGLVLDVLYDLYY